MSDEPSKRSWLWACAPIACVLVGAVVGYFAGMSYFCSRPGASDTGCALMTIVFVMPWTAALGFVVYVVARMISLRR